MHCKRGDKQAIAQTSTKPNGNMCSVENFNEAFSAVLI